MDAAARREPMHGDVHEATAAILTQLMDLRERVRRVVVEAIGGMPAGEAPDRPETPRPDTWLHKELALLQQSQDVVVTIGHEIARLERTYGIKMDRDPAMRPAGEIITGRAIR